MIFKSASASDLEMLTLIQTVSYPAMSQPGASWCWWSDEANRTKQSSKDRYNPEVTKADIILDEPYAHLESAGFIAKNRDNTLSYFVTFTVCLCVPECDSSTCVVAVEVVLLLDPHICWNCTLISANVSMMTAMNTFCKRERLRDSETRDSGREKCQLKVND